MGTGLERPEWMDNANCRSASWHLFFPDERDNLVAAQAKAICRACEVRAECLDFGLHERYGVWGGMSVRERQRERRRRRVA